MSLRELQQNHRIAFARAFRSARADALRDAEAFEPFLFALERLGAFVTQAQKHLDFYKPALNDIAKDSPLHALAAARFPEFHVKFDVLFEEARVARNDAMHQGTVARNLARHAQEIAMIMEEALMASASTANEFMVPEPVCAQLWEPISAIRRTILMNAFSYLPFQTDSGLWRLVSDLELVKFLRVTKKERDQRLLMTLDDALKAGLKSARPVTCNIEDPLPSLLGRMRDTPCLVLAKGKRLAGIVTAFDLL